MFNNVIFFWCSLSRFSRNRKGWDFPSKLSRIWEFFSKIPRIKETGYAKSPFQNKRAISAFFHSITYVCVYDINSSIVTENVAMIYGSQQQKPDFPSFRLMDFFSFSSSLGIIGEEISIIFKRWEKRFVTSNICKFRLWLEIKKTETVKSFHAVR